MKLEHRIGGWLKRVRSNVGEFCREFFLQNEFLMIVSYYKAINDAPYHAHDRHVHENHDDRHVHHDRHANPHDHLLHEIRHDNENHLFFDRIKHVKDCTIQKEWLPVQDSIEEAYRA